MTYKVTILMNAEAVATYSASTLGYAYKTAKEALFTWGSGVVVEIHNGKYREIFEGTNDRLKWCGRDVGNSHYYRSESGELCCLYMGSGSDRENFGFN
jgi:hypothetical protein